jgi:hypothetical protein
MMPPESLHGGRRELHPAQDAYPLLVTRWQSWIPGGRPQGLCTAEFNPPSFVDPTSAQPNCGPCLHLTACPEWGAFLAVPSKASDDHIKLIGGGSFPTFSPADTKLAQHSSPVLLTSVAVLAIDNALHQSACWDASLSACRKEQVLPPPLLHIFPRPLLSTGYIFSPSLLLTVPKFGL